VADNDGRSDGDRFLLGRNIFQSDNPVAMIRAVGAVVHESLKPQAAYDQFLGERGRPASPSP
jgi:putative autoinducer-2 (AI-2) aldolase